MNTEGLNELEHLHHQVPCVSFTRRELSVSWDISKKNIFNKNIRSFNKKISGTTQRHRIYK